MNFKNTFGSATSAGGIDLQRVDLWRVNLVLPQIAGTILANNVWANEVQFALEKFPFPERAREMIEVKYMQQTNYLIGKDMATPAIEVPVRYAFQALTAQVLEQWNYLCANPQTGGIGLTSAVKAKGTMQWYVPDMSQQAAGIAANPSATDNILEPGLYYVLEGCIIKGLRFTDADMTQSAAVNLLFSLQIDRYYPADVTDMQVLPTPST
jgi:hypothetical protein